MTDFPRPDNRWRGLPRMLLVLILLAGAGAALYSLFGGPSSREGFSSDPVIERIEKIGKLAVLKVYVADVLSKSDDSYFRGIEGIWIVKGDALLTVDFGRIEFVETDPEARKATLRITRPRVESARVDHERSSNHAFEKGWFANPQEVMTAGDHAYKLGQEAIRRLAGNEENILAAQTNAELLLKNHLKMVGWQASIEWKD